MDDAGVLDALRPMLRVEVAKGDRLQARRSDQTSSDARSTAASLEPAEFVEQAAQVTRHGRPATWSWVTITRARRVIGKGVVARIVTVRASP